MFCHFWILKWPYFLFLFLIALASPNKPQNFLLPLRKVCLHVCTKFDKISLLWFSTELFGGTESIPYLLRTFPSSTNSIYETRTKKTKNKEDLENCSLSFMESLARLQHPKPQATFYNISIAPLVVSAWRLTDMDSSRLLRAPLEKKSASAKCLSIVERVMKSRWSLLCDPPSRFRTVKTCW